MFKLKNSKMFQQMINEIFFSGNKYLSLKFFLNECVYTFNLPWKSLKETICTNVQ